MEHDQLQEFQRLMVDKTGLHLREITPDNQWQKLTERMSQLGYASLSQYCSLLKGNSAQSRAEWDSLGEMFTIGESYFFRDEGQFNLLRNTILPELIADKKSQKTVRIWSAGCSSGEEPYSLAMLLRELLPALESWRIFILATDINQQVLAKAARGIYSQWSFRMVQPEIQQKYFRRAGKEFELSPRVRNMVTLQQLNLVDEQFPNPARGLFDMDLILCRNVFIYFERQAIVKVAAKFAETLRPRGYLVTGHAELAGKAPESLKSIMLPESLIYQKCDSNDNPAETLHTANRNKATAVNSAITLAPAARNTEASPKSNGTNTVVTNKRDESRPMEQWSHEVAQLIKTGKQQAAVDQALQWLSVQGGKPEPLYFLALAYANTGRYQQAKEYCETAIGRHPFFVPPYALSARIAEAMGDTATAKNFWKKILYLAPTYVPAYLELGEIYLRENDSAKTHKMRRAALSLVEKMAPNSPLELYGEQTAGEVLAWLRSDADGI